MNYFSYNPVVFSFSIFNSYVFIVNDEKKNKLWFNAYRNSCFNYFLTYLVNEMITIPVKPVFQQSDVLLIIPYILLTDVAFYSIHRLFHTKYLYYFHKQHHVWNNPISISTFDAHPLEHLCINVFSVVLPLYVFPVSTLQQSFWIMLATINGIRSHKVNNNKITPHILHHNIRRVNYGTGFHIMDRLLGTYKSV